MCVCVRTCPQRHSGNSHLLPCFIPSKPNYLFSELLVRSRRLNYSQLHRGRHYALQNPTLQSPVVPGKNSTTHTRPGSLQKFLRRLHKSSPESSDTNPKNRATRVRCSLSPRTRPRPEWSDSELANPTEPRSNPRKDALRADLPAGAPTTGVGANGGQKLSPQSERE